MNRDGLNRLRGKKGMPAKGIAHRFDNRMSNETIVISQEKRY